MQVEIQVRQRRKQVAHALSPLGCRSFFVFDPSSGSAARADGKASNRDSQDPFLGQAMISEPASEPAWAAGANPESPATTRARTDRIRSFFFMARLSERR